MKKILESIWPSIIWTIVIFVLLSLDGQKLKHSSRLFDFEGADKVIHCVIFLMYAMLWSLYGLNKIDSTRRLYLIVIITGSIYGLGMEYYQQFFTNREFSYWDALADSIGAIAGTFLIKKSPYGNRGRNQN